LDWIRKNKDTIVDPDTKTSFGTLVMSAQPPGTTFDEYCDALANGAYGDFFTLFAAANIWDVDIVVITASGGKVEYIQVDPLTPAANLPVFLVLHARKNDNLSHYNSLAELI
jgi:hypothetical protein